MRSAWLLAVLWGLAGLGGARAQDDPGIPTLRVFTNLIQIPTLVLDDHGLPVEERTHPHFMVQLDGGKAFPATHVRLEGDDPLSLAVILDARGAETALLRELPRLLALQVPAGMEPHDHVSVYAFDCALLRTANDVPAAADELRAAAERALRAPELHAGKVHGRCPAEVGAPDAVANVAHAMRDLPGRRVILAVSSGGEDEGDRARWEVVQGNLQTLGTTLFGLTLASNERSPTMMMGRGTLGALGGGGGRTNFAALAQSSGGVVLTASDVTLGPRLGQFFRLVRARFIVQFPRNDALGGGRHHMDITVTGRDYFIRPSGRSVPLADPKLKEDPTVIQGLAGEPPGR